MNNPRAFALGVLIGIAGALIPDLPSAIIMHAEQPERRTMLYVLYGAFVLLGILIWLELQSG